MKKILVIGDSCKDVFVYCHAQRLAPDRPIPILDVIEEVENPGMAANVVRNIKAIHDTCDLYTNEGWEKVTKTRYVHSKTNHSFIRIDSNCPVRPIDVTKIPLDEFDIIAISDYDKGSLSREDIAHVCAKHPCVFLDTKKPVGEWAKDAAYIKINEYEYAHSRTTLTPEIEARVIWTEGEHGAHHQGVHYPVTEKVEVQDTSGAGDSFYAALLVRYAETGAIDESIRFANECARRVVARKGVSVIERP